MTLGKKEGRRQTETKQPFVCLEVVVYLDRQSMGPAFPKLAIGLGPSCITTRCESQWQLTTPEVGGTSDCPSIWFAMGSGVANFCGECQITHVRLKREHKKTHNMFKATQMTSTRGKRIEVKTTVSAKRQQWYTNQESICLHSSMYWKVLSEAAEECGSKSRGGTRLW